MRRDDIDSPISRPGRYFIVASVFGYPTFYPSGANADRATVITIAADKPSEGVNFSVQMPPGGRVSGRVNSPVAQGVQEKAVLSGIALGELLESPIGADGSFTFGHLPKGSYLLSLFPALPGMPSKYFASRNRTSASTSFDRRCAPSAGVSSFRMVRYPTAGSASKQRQATRQHTSTQTERFARSSSRHVTKWSSQGCQAATRCRRFVSATRIYRRRSPWDRVMYLVS